MANVQVIQRHAHLAGPVRLDHVKGQDGQIARATFTAISNTRKGSGEQREEEVTSILWTVWGRQAENAAQYLGKGSHVNVIGRVRSERYQNAEGATVHGMAFTAEEIDYLDSRAQVEARRSHQEFVAEMEAAEAEQTATNRGGRQTPPARRTRSASAQA